MTKQEIALEKVQELYGKSGFTEDHVHYRCVGYKEGRLSIIGLGDTWEQAFVDLDKHKKKIPLQKPGKAKPLRTSLDVAS